MTLKKSDLYSSLWASCDELRGGMDASQYKDYVLFMLFIKYISDKYGDSDDFAPPVTIPPGASFKDMVALKGDSDIGNKINTQVIQPLIDANSRLARSDFPDFNDPNKLGEGAAKRADVIHEWHKTLLHEAVPLLIQKWERKLKVDVRCYFLQRMKTKWGSCNHRAGHIRLNTELVKKPKDLLEYVIVHEMAHLIEPTHSDRFIAVLQEHYPTWREARAELNELTLAAEVWNE